MINKQIKHIISIGSILGTIPFYYILLIFINDSCLSAANQPLFANISR